MRYRILGQLELWNGDQQIPLGPAKWRTLLAVLLCDANRVVSPDRLIEELWSGEPPQSASKLLQNYVSRVRRALGDDSGQVLVTHAHGYRAQGYRLVVRADEVDAHRFDHCVEQGRRDLEQGSPETAVARLSEALELWRGAPFADVPPTPATEAEAARLEACRAQAQEVRIEAQLRLGRHEAVLGELETLVATHPLREGLRGKLMLALHRAGRRDDALAAYRDLRHVLVEELGVEPSPPLQELERQILNADAELLTAPASSDSRAAPAPQPIGAKPRQLPYANTTFIGRDSEIAVLQQLLGGSDREAVVISAIHGTGGVGKSALTLHVAHRLLDRFPDGQLYVDLHGVTEGLSPVEPGEVLGRFLTALGVERTAVPDDVDEAASMFRSLVADRRLLVVLDNAANVEQVRPLLPAGERCAALITSREILATLEGATHMYLDVLFHDQATALLKQMVGAERVEAEPEAVDAIIQMCGGLPLALRIIGARLAARPGWTLRSFTDRLADAQNRLDELRVGDLTVRASFHASYEGFRHSRRSIDQYAARAFRLFGVVPGPNVSLPVAAALFDLTATRAEDALERLVDAHLLRSPAPGRYQMHDLLRLFAREQAQQEEPAAEQEAALDRLVRYYLVTAQEAVILLDPSRPVPMRSVVEGVNRVLPFKTREEAEAWLESEHANLVATVTHAVTQTDSVARYAVWLTQPLQWFLYPRARIQDLQTINELALSTARRLCDPESEALALNNLSAAHWLYQRYDEMRACLESALAIWRELGDHRGEQRSLCNLADALTELELYEEAISVQERQLSNARESGDRVAELTGLAGLGRAYQGLGRTSEALACFEQSFEHARQIGDANYEGYALYEIGVLKSEIGAATMDREMIEEGWAKIERALPACAQREAYTSWRGHAWSAFFPACMRLGATWDSSGASRP